MKTITKEVFVTTDGEEFTSEENALSHEREYLADEKRKKSLRVYRVNHSFDSTEGRGYFGAEYIITDDSLGSVIQHCMSKYGEVFQGWYGGSYYEAWNLHEINHTDLKTILSLDGTRPEYTYAHKPFEVTFISRKPIAGLPVPTFPWVEKPPAKERKSG